MKAFRNWIYKFDQKVQENILGGFIVGVTLFVVVTLRLL